MCQIKMFSIQEVNSDRPVHMAAVYYIGVILDVLMNEYLKKITCAKFQIDFFKTELLVHVYTGGHPNRRTRLN